MTTRVLSVAVALLASCGLGSCADEVAPPPVPAPAAVLPPPRDLAGEGIAAFDAGDVATAVRLLTEVPQGHPDFARAEGALALARTELEQIRETWLARIDRLLRQGRHDAARERALHLLAWLPDDEVSRRAAEQRLQAADQARAAAAADLDELDRQGREAMDRADWAAASRVLRRALVVAQTLEPDRLLKREQILVALEQRVPKPKARPRGKARADERIEKVDVPAAVVPPTPQQVGPEADVDAEADAVANKVGELLRSAAAFQETRAYFNAIVAYRQARELDPDNSAARLALEGLDGRRVALVDEYLRVATEYFLKQDLAGAVPYYRRVLLLDANNEQALKGLQMHYNLERIQRENRPKGR